MAFSKGVIENYYCVYGKVKGPEPQKVLSQTVFVTKLPNGLLQSTRLTGSPTTSEMS